MGAWGEGVFENDAAGDWVDQFEHRAPTSIVSKALAAVIKVKNPDSDRCSAALAAAEIVAAARGNPCGELPAEIKGWIMEMKFQADDELAALAVKSLVRIGNDSELCELWEHESTWRCGLDNLRKRLQRPAQPVRYRTSKASRSGGVREAKRAIEAFGGYLRVDRAGVAHVMLPDDVTDEQWSSMLRDHFDVLATMDSLVLQSKSITDASLEAMSPLPKLESLYLHRSSVTDGGMPWLCGMKSLAYLALDRTAVSDQGLMALVGSQLRCVAVHDSKVTLKGIERYKKAMPNCFVGPSWEWVRSA